jgi:fluoride exporter
VILAGVVVAGALGAACRYLVDAWIVRLRVSAVPLGTLVVNLSGSLMLGLVAGLLLRGAISAELATVLGAGFLGAYTTFSTWAYESVRLLEEGHWKPAAATVVGGLASGAAAAGLGLALTAAL